MNPRCGPTAIIVASALLAAACSAPPPSTGTQPSARKPNILLIVVESLRYDSISRAPGAARTPHLHELAGEGVSFRSCFSHSPASQPSLASLLSSRLPHEHGVMSNGGELDEDVALLPEHRSRGIGTALLRALIAEAAANGQAVTLSVDRDSPARSLYRRLGFATVSEDAVYAAMAWHQPKIAS